MRFLGYLLSFSFCIVVIASCGSSKGNLGSQEPSNYEKPENNPVENGEAEGGGKVKMKSITGAEPNMDSPKEAKEVDLSDIKSDATEIEWLDFETAIDRNEKEKKFIFIDVYTTWCSWCKKMDQSTFKHPDVVRFMDENFYCVKMDAEGKEAIAYKETLYELKPYGSKKYNELAVNLMSGKMSFPSFVILNKREVKRGIISGYQTSNQLISALDKYLN